jgi:hypothetical protein
MNKIFKIPIRVALAFAVAFISDGLQIFIVPMTGTGILAIPGEIIDIVVDVITAGMLSLLLGFHPVLLPSFVIKAVPLIDAIPTWTACVTYLAWKRNRNAADKPQTTDTPNEPKPATAKPRTATLSVSTAPIAANTGSSSLRYLAAAVAVVAGLSWFIHWKHEPTPQPRRDDDNKTEVKQDPPPNPAPVVTPAATRIPNANPLVVVGPIENEATASQNARFRQRQTGISNQEKIRTVIEDMLTEISGVHLLERQQAQIFLSQWKKDDGMTAAQRAAKLQMTTLPNLIVFLAIVDFHDENLNFKGYGVTQKSVETTCSLRLQVMDTSDGSITFTKMLTGTKTIQNTDALQDSSTEDSGFEAIKVALKKLDGDAAFQDAVRGVKQEQVDVEFAPTPDNCDIEIDGNYVGGSPLTKKLLSGKEIKVRISKAGFKDWQGKLSPQAGLRVTRELEPVQAQTP